MRGMPRAVIGPSAAPASNSAQISMVSPGKMANGKEDNHGPPVSRSLILRPAGALRTRCFSLPWVTQNVTPSPITLSKSSRQTPRSSLEFVTRMQAHVSCSIQRTSTASAASCRQGPEKAGAMISFENSAGISVSALTDASPSVV